ncbi:short-chain dehydrogenase/reductase-like protein SDR [Mycotypha africana]|uniref:short-chain dehydrogenase/reductase-like protein SDR n=1 Tax=Mycotypha africana TaxID=64632 RepID=UPI002300E2A6|nr:short-chain dehydrogenase/reductase-like protein SDR [Mycotypha africana]KAI8973820.1 short-chain dehydrogenase/reductase-like protein SDR [Mycotypha africana]
MKVDGLTFIVTGGASGLGKEVARTLVSQGAFVSIFDINVDSSRNIASELGEDRCFVAGSVNVTVEADVAHAIAKTLEHFSSKKLGGVIISSGIVTPPATITGYGPDQVLTSYAQFEHVIGVNLLGAYCVAQKVSEILLKNNPFNKDGERGIIITVSSILGLDGLFVGYGTSKAGLTGLTLPLAKELSSFGIRVMSIAPGVFDTPIVDRSNKNAPIALFPRRLGEPTEFADLVLRVIDTPMLNGSVIRLDGALHV